MRDALLCDGVRTPFGRYGGALATVRPDDLAAHVIKALIARNPALAPEAIDEVVLGCANQAGEDNRNVARMAALLAGLPESVPGVTVNRLCASGADAIGTAARAIAVGAIDIAVAGGVESMSRAPFVVGKADKPWSRAATIEDTTIGWRFVNPAMDAAHGTHSMPATAENVAADFGISREEQDRFALSSQRRTAAAATAGYFTEEIVATPARAGKAGMLVASDEHPRPDTTLDTLAKLRPVVHADGSVTAGNASGVNDGAGVVLLASADAAARHGLVPRARILGMASAGVAPRVMGIGPAPASQRLMARLGLTLGDFDLIEINEAFAAQVIASMRLLGADPFADHVNPHGGAIALGHPLGASGARLVLTALRGLEASGGRRALVTMCIGVGQGLALALERV
ncbi:3-oxoadipyl-CoA thiolase [Sphingomonas fennica]|uniref:3-oxoadipyl-CoA thiolase n=1 Tax=Edaphosphingomonas fennica TaxID=114404 RepID=A0A2T4HLZ7_9SPHN|nr:3-oxoadipyl-CoA thiolase [Sphingomonas fennica]PTD16820.1 3-oxoadipyl-CoA thiolase [Sphingomonas fennica]